MKRIVGPATLCLNCGRVLTNKHGRRLESANFDSALPVKSTTHDSITWARCDSCYGIALAMSEKPSVVMQAIERE